MRQTMGLRIDDAVRHWWDRFPWSGMTEVEVERAVTARVAELIGRSGVPMPGALESLSRCASACRSRWRSAPAPMPWSSRPPWPGWGLKPTWPSGTRPSGSPWASPTRGATCPPRPSWGSTPRAAWPWRTRSTEPSRPRRHACGWWSSPNRRAFESPRWGFCDALLPSLAGFDEHLLRSLEGRARLTAGKFHFGNGRWVPIDEARGAFPGQGRPSDVGPLPEAGRSGHVAPVLRVGRDRRVRYGPSERVVAPAGRSVERQIAAGAALVACGREPRCISRPPRCGVDIGVLASGTGSILEAILAADLPGPPGGRRPAVPGPRGGRRRLGAGGLVDRSGFGGFGAAFDRDAYTEAVTDALVAPRHRRGGHGRLRHRARPGRSTPPSRAGSSTPIPPCCPPSRVGTRWPTPWPPGWTRPGPPSISPPWRWMPARCWPKKRCRCSPATPRLRFTSGSKRSNARSIPTPSATSSTGWRRRRGWDRITNGGCAMRALLSVYDKTGLVEFAARSLGAGLGTGLEWRHVGGPGRGRRSPTPRWRSSPAPRRCSAAGSRPSTRPSTGASWPTGLYPSTWPRSTVTASVSSTSWSATSTRSPRIRRSSSSTSAGRPWCGPRRRTMITSGSSSHPPTTRRCWPSCARTGRSPMPPAAGWPATPSPTPRATTPPSSSGSTSGSCRRSRSAGRLADRRRCPASQAST